MSLKRDKTIWTIAEQQSNCFVTAIGFFKTDLIFTECSQCCTRLCLILFHASWASSSFYQPNYPPADFAGCILLYFFLHWRWTPNVSVFLFLNGKFTGNFLLNRTSAHPVENEGLLIQFQDVLGVVQQRISSWWCSDFRRVHRLFM